MHILIIDDDNTKIANIVTAIKSVSNDFRIDAGLSCKSALKKLKENKYDLLILDIFLPINDDTNPVENGGAYVIQEISRKSYNVPNYIIGLTEYTEYAINFSSIWKVIIYNPNFEEWENSIKNLISHIYHAKQTFIDSYFTYRPTIFVEGLTDKKLIETAIEIFSPESLGKIEVKSEKSAGSSWVARQIIIWAKSLSKDENGAYHKAIGILDGDRAGNDALKEINRVVLSDSMERNTFKIIKLTPSHARSLIPLYAKGLNIPVTLEEVFDIHHWKIANSNNWLNDRPNLDTFLKDPKGWDKINDSLRDHILKLGLNQDEMIYLKRFDDKYKEDFCKYILRLKPEEKSNALQNFVYILNEINDWLSSSNM